MSTQKEDTTPLEGRPGEGHLLPLSRGPPGTSSVGNGGKHPGVPRQLGKQKVCIPTNTHEAQSVHFPSPGTWSQKGKCWSPQAPSAGGRGCRVEALLPCPHHCELVPTDQDKEHMWAEAAGRC